MDISENLKKQAVDAKVALISKLDLVGSFDDKKTGVSVEITGHNPIDGGVEVYARVYRDGQQLGFGDDGSVDIERFVIYNPPLMVADGTKRQVKDKNTGGVAEVDNFVENPVKAIQETVAHAGSLMGKSDTKIEQGKIGRTTTTFFATVNGDTGYNVGGAGVQDWATVVAGAGNYADETDTQASGMLWKHGPVNNVDNWYYLMRSVLLFDTSAIGSGSTISAAVLSLFGSGKDDPRTLSPNVDIYTCNPASTTSLTGTDFATFGSTSQTGSPIAYSSWSIVAYNDFTFNGTGIGNISKTGISKFGTRNQNHDVAGTNPGNMNNSEVGVMSYYSIRQAGTSQDPKLVVTFSVPTVIKTVDGLAVASVKTIDGLAIASVKTWNGTQ